jgi:acid phosphatase class B
MFTPIQQDRSLPSAYIFDIDWTVALMNGRTPYEYDRVSEDLLNTHISNILISLYDTGYRIIFATGRPWSCVDDTTQWLSDKLCLKNSMLFMRKTWDKRPDTEVKREILEQLTKEYYIEWVFEDRTRCVQMYRESGMTCFQVAEGNF